MSIRWFAFSDDGTNALRCASCGEMVDLGEPTADHHLRLCPACRVGCVFLNWKERTVQIVISTAPSQLRRAIEWAQRDLDELDYVELLCALEELHDSLLRQEIERSVSNSPLDANS